MKNEIRATIESSIKECDSHVAKCIRAQNLLAKRFPLLEEDFSKLQEEQIEHIDQFIGCISR